MRLIVLCFIVGVAFVGCVGLGHLQKEEPIRKMEFSGSHKQVATCIQSRLGGKVEGVVLGNKISVYNSVKGYQHRGMSHFAMTVSKTTAGRGVVEWRKLPAGPMDKKLVTQFWSPVEDCVRRAASS